MEASSTTTSHEERLSHSQKKQLKRFNYQMNRKNKRCDKRRAKRDQQQLQRKTYLDNMTEEERRIYINDERAQQELFLVQQQLHIEDAYKNGLKICVNCSFDDSMFEKELKSLAKQLFFSYHSMKKHLIPLQFTFTSFDLEGIVYEECLKFHFDKWKVHHTSEAYWDVFPPDKLVVLTPDAEEDLTEIDKEKVYVIGGIVDRTISKNESYLQATKMGLTVRKLPFRRYIKESMSTVLNINTVVDVLIYYLKTGSWETALTECVPKRKQQMMGRRGLKRMQKREAALLKVGSADESIDAKENKAVIPSDEETTDDEDRFGDLFAEED